MPLHNRLVYYILISLLTLASYIPTKVLHWINKLIFIVGYYATSYRKNIVIQNLSRSFPEKSYQEIKDIARQFYKYFYSLFSEWLKLFSLNKKHAPKYVEFENLELLNQYYAEGKSVILVLGHFGNWEYLSFLPLYVKQDVYAVYKKLRNPAMDKLMGKLRARFNVLLLEAKKAYYFTLKNQHNPSIYIYISDQAPSTPTKHICTFLNQTTSFYLSVERLALKDEFVIVYTEIMPISKGKYKIKFSPLIQNQPIIHQFAAHLEASIATAPQYWLWTHKRWKHKLNNKITDI